VTGLGKLETDGVKTCLEPSTISSIAGATDMGSCELSSKPLSQKSSEVVADRQQGTPLDSSISEDIKALANSANQFQAITKAQYLELGADEFSSSP
jgi:hypothetical protein